MHPYSYSISLRVKHPTKDLSYLSNFLGLQINGGWLVGEKRRNPKGNLLKGNYEESYWYTKLVEKENNKKINLENSLTFWVEKLSIYKSEFEKLNTSNGKVEFFIWLYCDHNMAFELNINLLKNISNLGVSLDIVCDP